MVYRVIATKTDKPNHEAPKTAVRNGIRYQVRGTVLILGMPNNIGAYIEDVRVERAIRHAGKLLFEEGASKIEIIVTKPAR